MSVRVMSDAWLVKCETHTQKLVLMALADNANDQMECWPSIAAIAKKCDLSCQGVINQISALESLGFLVVERKHRASNRYKLCINGVESTALSQRRLVNGVDSIRSTRLTQLVNGVDTNRKEPSLEPPSTGQSEKELGTHAESQAGGTPVSPPHVPPSPSPVDALFEKFWAAYPRKVSKGDARKAFPRALKKVSDVSVILKALEIHKRLPGWVKDDGQFIPYPASWLNDERWSDEVKKDRGHNLWSKVDPKSKQW